MSAKRAVRSSVLVVTFGFLGGGVGRLRQHAAAGSGTDVEDPG